MDGLLPFPSLEFMNIMSGVIVMLVFLFSLAAPVVAIEYNVRSYNLLLWGGFFGLLAVLCGLMFFFYIGDHQPVYALYLSALFAILSLVFVVIGTIKYVWSRKNSRG